MSIMYQQLTYLSNSVLEVSVVNDIVQSEQGPIWTGIVMILSNLIQSCEGAVCGRQMLSF